jgi:hypothetical protein
MSFERRIEQQRKAVENSERQSDYEKRRREIRLQSILQSSEWQKLRALSQHPELLQALKKFYEQDVQYTSIKRKRKKPGIPGILGQTEIFSVPVPVEFDKCLTVTEEPSLSDDTLGHISLKLDCAWEPTIEIMYNTQSRNVIVGYSYGYGGHNARDQFSRVEPGILFSTTFGDYPYSHHLSGSIEELLNYLASKFIEKYPTTS